MDIYKHHWLASGNLIQPPLDQPSTTVSELMDSTKKGWDIAKIKGMFEADIAKQIIQTPIQWSAGPDSLWWPSTKSGEYTVKTGYYEAKKHNQTTDLGPSTSDMVDGLLWKTIWALKIPQKLKYFL